MIHSIGNPPAPPNPTTFGGSYEADKRSVSFDLCDNDDLEKKGKFVVFSGKENIFTVIFHQKSFPIIIFGIPVGTYCFFKIF